MVYCLGCHRGITDSIVPYSRIDTTSHAFTWSRDTLGIYPSLLNGVWGTSPTNVFAVGLIYSSYSQPPVNILHWDGNVWSQVNYLEGELVGIYGFTSSDFWVVGYYQVDQRGYALISHWDGSIWTTWKPPQFSQLTSIWGTSSSDMYAVGRGGLILHFDGSTWRLQTSGTSIDLLSVWGTDAAHLYSAGYDLSSGRGILLEFKSTGWTTVTNGSTVADSSTLYGGFASVWGPSPDTLFLVGALSYQGAPGHWRLSSIPFNSPGQNLVGLSAFNAVRGQSGADAFICGSHDLIIHWNGNSWNTFQSYFDKSKNSDLRSIWFEGGCVFIVGYDQSMSTAEIYRGYR